MNNLKNIYTQIAMKYDGFLELFTKLKSHQSPARQSTRQMPERKWQNISNSSTSRLPFTYSVRSQGLLSRRCALLFKHSASPASAYLNNTYVTTSITYKGESMSSKKNH